MSAPRWDAIVVGAGANGLVAATMLGRAGRRVLVVDRADAVGGQARRIEFAPGFLAAPLAARAGWLPPAVARATGIALPAAGEAPPRSVPLGPGAWLSLPADPARAAEALRPISARDAARWPEFAARLHRLAGFLGELYQRPAPDVDASTPEELLSMLALGRAFRGLGRADMVAFLSTLPLSVADLADDEFEAPALRAAIALAGIHDHQQGPRSGGTGFVLLHHLTGAPVGALAGRRDWRAGPTAFVEAAEAAARAAGVTVRTGAVVRRIDIGADRVTGVTLESGETLATAAVVSTADPVHTLRELVDPVWLDPEFLRAVGNIRFRGCTAHVLYALETLPEVRGLAPGALGGWVSLAGDPAAFEQAADAAKYGTVSDVPVVEITAPTMGWPDLAPAGRHVLHARVQYAPWRLRDGAAWDAARGDALAEVVTAQIAAVMPGLNGAIRARATLGPGDLATRFGLREGAASQGELGLDQILFMRPVAGWGRHATPIDGLFLGGAGSHPGPGILGGAGWLAARRLLGAARKGTA